MRTGAATLMIGSKPGEGEPSALDLRYQGTIIRTARECHVNAGVMTMKVGIEGRVITGPAGGPGTVDVPLRIAVVQEGPNAEDHHVEVRAHSGDHHQRDRPRHLHACRIRYHVPDAGAVRLISMPMWSMSVSTRMARRRKRKSRASRRKARQAEARKNPSSASTKPMSQKSLRDERAFTTRAGR